MPSMPGFRQRAAAAVAILFSLGPAAQGQAPLAELGPRARLALEQVAASQPIATQPSAPQEAAMPAAVQAAVMSAKEALEDGRVDAALRHVREALDEAGETIYYDLAYQYALVLIRQRRLDEGLLQAQRALQVRPDAADAHLLAGNVHHIMGRLPAAIAHYRSATLAADRELNNPRVTAAWFRLGQVLAEEGYHTAAEAAYARFDAAIHETHTEHRNAPEVKPILVNAPHGALEARLDLLERLGQREQAAAVTARAVEQDPQRVYLARLHARRLIDAGRATDALKFCRERASAGSAAPFVSLMAEAARDAGALADWLLEIDPQDAALARPLARTLRTLQRPAEAAALWARIHAAAPADAAAAWEYSAAQRSAGQTRQAIDLLGEFVRTNPQAHVPASGLAAWMQASTDADAVLALVSAAAADGQTDAARRFALGVAAVGLGKTALADELLSAALQQQETLVPALVLRAQLALREYRWDDARKLAEAALQVSDSAAARVILAEAAAGLDRWDDALNEFRAAMRLAPQEPAYPLALARHHARRGEGPGAERYFQQAWSLMPSNGEAAEELIRSYIMGGKLEIAREQIKLAQDRDLPPDALRRIQTMLRFAGAFYQEEHIAELRRQLAAHSDDLVTGLQLSAALLVLGQHDEAAEVLEQIRGLDPQDERWLQLHANVQCKRMNFAAAIESYEQLVRRFPRRTALLSKLTEAYLSDFRPQEARASLRKVIELAEEDAQRDALRVALLRSYVEFRDTPGALALLAEWNTNDSEPLMLARLQALLNLNRGQDAVALAEAQLDANIDDPQMRDLFIRVCMDAKDYERAERRLRRWLEDADEGQPAYSAALFELLITSRQADEAAELAESYTASDWNGAIEKRQMQARALIAQRKIDEGVREFEAMLSERPITANPSERMRLRGLLTAALIGAREGPRAVRLVQDWLAQEGENAGPIRMNLLNLLRGAAQSAQDDETYTQAMESLFELAPRDAGLSNDLGYTLIDRGLQLQRATRLVRFATAEDPLNPAYLDSLGWAYYKAGDFSQARHFLGRAVQLRLGQDPVLYDHLGDADYRLGDKASAARQWHAALALIEGDPSPDSTSDRTKLAAALRGKLDALERGEPVDVAAIVETKSADE